MNKTDKKMLELAGLLKGFTDAPGLEQISRRFPELGPARLKELLVCIADEIQGTPHRGKPRKKTVQEPLFCDGHAASGNGVLRIDGASRGNPGPAAAAAILETADGKTVEEAGTSLGPQTNNHAEYKALILGLEIALKRGFGTLEVYSDSQLLVRQMTGEYKVRHPEIARLKDEADNLVRRFLSVGFHHVPREQNSRADALANRVLDGRYRP